MHLVHKNLVSSIQAIINFLLVSIVCYTIFTQLTDIKLIYILIFTFAIGSIYLFDLINIISTTLIVFCGALLAEFISIFVINVLWQYGAILSLFVVLLGHIYLALSKNSQIQNNFYNFLYAVIINLFLFTGAYLIKPFF